MQTVGADLTVLQEEKRIASEWVNSSRHQWKVTQSRMANRIAELESQLESSKVNISSAENIDRFSGSAGSLYRVHRSVMSLDDSELKNEIASLPTDQSARLVELKEEWVRREESKLREIEARVQREINEKRQTLLERESQLKEIEARVRRDAELSRQVDGRSQPENELEVDSVHEANRLKFPPRPRRRTVKELEKCSAVVSTKSDLVPSNPQQARSGVLNNRKLLPTVEDAIKRLTLPELNAIKEVDARTRSKEALGGQHAPEIDRRSQERIQSTSGLGKRENKSMLLERERKALGRQLEKQAAQKEKEFNAEKSEKQRRQEEELMAANAGERNQNINSDGRSMSPAASNQDWDAIFGPLDSSQTDSGPHSQKESTDLSKYSVFDTQPQAERPWWDSSEKMYTHQRYDQSKKSKPANSEQQSGKRSFSFTEMVKKAKQRNSS